MTGAQEGHGLSNSAASSAARALSNLAGAAARAAAARTAPPAGDSPPRTALATSDGHGYDRHGPDAQGPNGQGPSTQGPNGQGPNAQGPNGQRHGPVDFAATPAGDDEPVAATGPAAHDGDEPEVDPHLDDILPAKSKGFFRLRR